MSEMSNDDYQAKSLAALGAASNYKPRKFYSIREVENGFLVETGNGSALISHYEAGKGAYVAKTIEEACELILKAV